MRIRRYRFFRTTTAVTETAEHEHRPRCGETTDGSERPCLGFAEFVLTWTLNESGLPGLGDRRTDYVCGPHILKRVDKIPFEYAGSVTLTPVKEI